MKKTVITTLIIYTIVFWVGYILKSVDESISIGSAYVAFIGLGIFVGILSVLGFLMSRDGR